MDRGTDEAIWGKWNLPLMWRDVWRVGEAECVRNVKVDIFRWRDRWAGVSSDIYPPFKGVTAWHCWQWSGSKGDSVKFHPPDVSGCSWVFPMKFHDKVWGMNIFPRFPGIMLDSVSSHLTRYCNFQLITLLSKISSTTHSSSQSMISGRGGGSGCCPGIGSSGAGDNLTTLKTGCSQLMEGGSWRRYVLNTKFSEKSGRNLIEGMKKVELKIAWMIRGQTVCRLYVGAEFESENRRVVLGTQDLGLGFNL